MKNPALFSCALFLSLVCSISCGAISEPKDGVEEHVESSTPLEVAGKSGEVEVDEKTADLEQTSTETRVERSSEAAFDKAEENVESKIDPEAESDLKMAIEENDKSAESGKVDDKMADVNDAAEEMSSERSITGPNDAGLENNDEISIRTFNKDTKEVNDKSADDQSYISRETTRSMPYDTHGILDSKARTADNSEENLEIQAKSDLEAINAEPFGSRRRYSGSPGSPAFVTPDHSGLTFDDISFPMSNPNPPTFIRPNQGQIQPNDYFKTSSPSSSEYRTQNGPDPLFDPLSSSELKSSDRFSPNPFAISYPYVFQPQPSPNPTDNRYRDIDLIAKYVQPLENLNRPIVNFLGQNLKSLTQIPYKPLEQNVPFPIYRPFDNRFNQLAAQPPRYYKKCNYCNYP